MVRPLLSQVVPLVLQVRRASALPVLPVRQAAVAELQELPALRVMMASQDLQVLQEQE